MSTAPAVAPGALLIGEAADTFVRALTDEEKDALVTALVREAVRVNGDREPLPVCAESGELLAYVLPASGGGSVPLLTPEREAAIREAIANPDDTFDMHEMLERLRKEGRG